MYIEKLYAIKNWEKINLALIYFNRAFVIINELINFVFLNNKKSSIILIYIYIYIHIIGKVIKRYGNIEIINYYQIYN